jgi:GrpB-like predicted nucleotidyltransferase (UPF0157 family)
MATFRDGNGSAGVRSARATLNRMSPEPDPGDWPAWATEPVVIVDYDQGWALQAAQERQRLLTLLRPWLADDIHHVGSTAIPGLPAKPIIDLMAGVGSLDDAPAMARVLAPHDWHLVPPELDARPWRRLLVKVVAGRRVAHLHLLNPGTTRWAEQLRFRDRLCARPALAAEYGELKRRLAQEHTDDREAYSGGKAAFVRRVLAEQD